MQQGKTGYSMAETERYIQILTESLKKKIEILDTLLVLNEKQAEVIRTENSLDAFDQLVDEKAVQIALLEKLDTGFETIYQHVRPEVTQHPERYKAQINEIQSLIKELTDRSVRVETTEKRNKQAIEQYFAAARKDLHESRRSMNVANNYYKSMTNSQYVDPQMINYKQ